MKATLIKVDLFYHLWLNPNTKDQEHIASDNPIMDIRGVHLRKYKLSKQNCDEIFGVIDVEKLAEENAKFKENFVIESSQVAPYRLGFRNGYNKAMELNKDKLFTLEDIRIAIVYGEKHRDMDAGKIPYQPFFEFLSSLQKPTEIEVEIEMEENCMPMPNIHQKIYLPKLGSDGCLILKKI